MTRVQGLTHAELDNREEVFVGLFRSALDRVAATVAMQLAKGTRIAAAEPAPEVSLDDLASTRTEWLQEIDGTLMPYVSELYNNSALKVALGVRDALPEGVRSAIPSVRDEIAEAYLANRRNFLAGVGNDLWTEMREGLLDGFKQGESIPQLRDRVRQSAGFTMGRAEAVARTEVVGASNAGAFDQVRATGLPARKSWLATEDLRTRESHRRVDGTTVDLDEKFTVGGWPMDRPHDPSAPPEEVVRCRCTLIYDVDTTAPIEGVEPPPEPQFSSEPAGKAADTAFNEWFESGLPEGNVFNVQAPYAKTEVMRKISARMRRNMSTDEMRGFLNAYRKSDVGKTNTIGDDMDWWNHVGDDAYRFFRCGVTAIGTIGEIERYGRCSKTGGWVEVEGEEMLSDYLSSELVHNWSISSSDSHVWSLAMQQAVKDEFGLTDAIVRLPGTGDVFFVRSEYEEILAGSSKYLRLFVRAMYDQTQEELAAAGIESITVYRGFDFSSFAQSDIPSWARGAAKGSVTSELQFQPASSFAYDRKQANKFARGQFGVVVQTTVPRSRILSTSRTGWGCLNERELVLLDTRGELTIVRTGVSSV